MKKHKCKCGEDNPCNFSGRHKSTCKKCMAIKSRDRYRNLSKEDKVKYIDNAKNNFSEWVADNPLQYRLNLAKSRAKNKGLKFDLTLDYLNELLFNQKGRCPYTNVILSHTENKLSNSGGIETISIDRIDSKLGYVRGNVELVSSLVNIMKNDMNKEDFLNVVGLIYEGTQKS